MWHVLGLALFSLWGPQTSVPVDRETTFEGLVLAADGTPVVGAHVASSSGRTTVTNVHGRYRLRCPLPSDVDRVELFASRPSGESARTLAAFPSLPSGVPTTVAPLVLGPGPAWLPTFGGDLHGVDGTIAAQVVFDDGHGPALFVGGEFTHAGGVEAASLARWDGTEWSALGSGVGDVFFISRESVEALAVFDEGAGPRLFACGRFVDVGGAATLGIARWDGVRWSAVGGGFGGFARSGFALCEFDDGSGPALFAGGDFTSAGGVAANHVAKWDGTSWAALGAGTDGTVTALCVFDGGGGPALYAAGSFSSAGGVPASGIARWDGSAWSALGAGILIPSVEALTVFDDGTGPALFAGGSFTFAGGSANRVARWDGTSWSALGAGVSGKVSSLLAFDDGSGPALFAGGEFTQAGGMPARGLARWDGASWSQVGSGIGFSVLSLVPFDDGSGTKLHCGGGTLATGDNVLVSGLAVWDGTALAAAGGPVPGSFAHQARLVLLEDGGDSVYGNGRFSEEGVLAFGFAARVPGAWDVRAAFLPVAPATFDDGTGPSLYTVLEGSLSRWDGSAWVSLGGVLPGTAHVLAAHDDGSGSALYAGGSTSGSSTGFVARWDGSDWVQIHGTLKSVSGLWSVDEGGPKLFAGYFDRSAMYLDRWNGSSWADDSDFHGDKGPGAVQELVSFEGALYAAGDFLGVDSTAAIGLARRLPGGPWEAVGGGLDGSAFGLAVHDDGGGPGLFVGGAFTNAGGLAVRRLALWRGGEWRALGAGANGPVSQLLVRPGPEPALLAAGGFTRMTDSGDCFTALWGRDLVAPVIHAPASVTVAERLGSPPGEFVSFTVSALDEHDAAPMLAVVPPSGSFFPFGTTMVSVTATDAAGNQSTSAFPVTVRLKAAPPP